MVVVVLVVAAAGGASCFAFRTTRLGLRARPLILERG
jgi:hypothetical protein